MGPHSRPVDHRYCRDAIDAAIAAMSLFEGTVNEVGGGAIGALDLNTLPDIAAFSQSGDMSDVSHYWTWVGSPNYVLPAVGEADELGNGLSRDLAGPLSNPGDWVQIANRGGDGTVGGQWWPCRSALGFGWRRPSG